MPVTDWYFLNGMEEVVGSNLTRSTKLLTSNMPVRVYLLNCEMIGFSRFASSRLSLRPSKELRETILM
jgi:hypothetical protein